MKGDHLVAYLAYAINDGLENPTPEQPTLDPRNMVFYFPRAQKYTRYSPYYMDNKFQAVTKGAAFDTGSVVNPFTGRPHVQSTFDLDKGLLLLFLIDEGPTPPGEFIPQQF